MKLSATFWYLDVFMSAHHAWIMMVLKVLFAQICMPFPAFLCCMPLHVDKWLCTWLVAVDTYLLEARILAEACNGPRKLCFLGNVWMCRKCVYLRILTVYPGHVMCCLRCGHHRLLTHNNPPKRKIKRKGTNTKEYCMIQYGSIYIVYKDYSNESKWKQNLKS